MLERRKLEPTFSSQQHALSTKFLPFVIKSYEALYVLSNIASVQKKKNSGFSFLAFPWLNVFSFSILILLPMAQPTKWVDTSVSTVQIRISAKRTGQPKLTIARHSNLTAIVNKTQELKVFLRVPRLIQNQEPMKSSLKILFKDVA